MKRVWLEDGEVEIFPAFGGLLLHVIGRLQPVEVWHKARAGWLVPLQIDPNPTTLFRSDLFLSHLLHINKMSCHPLRAVVNMTTTKSFQWKMTKREY